jgi:alpha-tubulin suppressor-like RCC1 family protein
VYAWGLNNQQSSEGLIMNERLPKPVEAFRGVRVGSIAAGGHCSYVVTDTGELWAWGWDDNSLRPAMANSLIVFCPNRLSRCGASRWTR